MAAGLVALAGLALSAAQASADLLPPPPLPVSVPAVTVPVAPAVVPLPKIPKLPPPVLEAPVPAVSVSTPSSVSVPGTSGPAASPSSSPGPSRSSHRTAARRVTRLRAASAWIGTKNRPATTIVFVLPRAARVVVTVTQVSPVCAGVGHFTVAGHPGLNRVRFAAKFRGRRLAPGTYSISVRALGGKSVRRITVVVVQGAAPTRAELAAARSANACRGADGAARGSTGLPTGGELAAASRVERASTSKAHPSAIGGPNASNSHSGVLAVTAERAARVIRPLLVALLVLSILLLAIASLPKPVVSEPRLNDLLARHRLGLAGVGAAALVGVAIAFLIG